MHPFTRHHADSVSALGEEKLIAAIRRWLGSASPRAPFGIGDDCAVLPAARGRRLITVDPVIYGRHFDDTVPPRAVGAKLLKRKLSDLAAMGGQTSRIIVAALDDLRKRPDVHARFMDAYRETTDWIYTTPEGLKAYSDWAKVSEKIGRRALDEFLPRAAVQTDKIMGLEQNMRSAVEFKYLSAPLTQAQMDEFVKIPRPGK